ncbi:phosphoribosylpyrophosphate synthetase [Neptunitalea lumnitzerae]|uniref:Phosphoribosylpyrophosphate synthetase n=1 Tax=Neptunitalea lumnitzerae TaxID=2965509 RepID=A0ABQ5MKH7_9FLAO|nr:phosphoribosylpyrophosphate synthetase [Neptunitalea sp. Y10]GLB49913.1 hypothetical protein Y10_22810 [Neptunitalea sp. Y10]
MKVVYDTLSEGVEDLKKRGYEEDFNILENGIENKSKKQLFKTDTFNVVEVHRFEGYTNPDDSSILYAIETISGEKGILVDAYGAYESISREMIDKLAMHDK